MPTGLPPTVKVCCQFSVQLLPPIQVDEQLYISSGRGPIVPVLSVVQLPALGFWPQPLLVLQVLLVQLSTSATLMPWA